MKNLLGESDHKIKTTKKKKTTNITVRENVDLKRSMISPFRINVIVKFCIVTYMYLLFEKEMNELVFVQDLAPYISYIIINITDRCSDCI